MEDPQEHGGDDYHDISDGEEEDPQDYRPGGYHPVQLGDTFNHGQYIVRSKLGWGGYSTVWLAWDNLSQREVAIKVMMSQFMEAAKREAQILCDAHYGDPDGSRGVVRLIDAFLHEGPHGTHACIVFELLGDDLWVLLQRFGNPGLPLPAVKEICRQLMVSLDYLHRVLKVVHGDLKPDNVLLVTPLDKEEALAKVDLRCKLSDLGRARRVEDCAGISQTRPYRSPEEVLGLGYSTEADMWALACVCFELATGDRLFDPRAEENFDEDEDHLAYMIELLGWIDPHMCWSSPWSDRFFDESGELKHIKKITFLPLDELLVKNYGFSRRDADAMAQFLLPMLDYSPRLRPRASGLLNHPWLNAGPWRLQPSPDAASAEDSEEEDEVEEDGEPNVGDGGLETLVDATAGEEDPREGEDGGEEEEEFDADDIRLVLQSLGRQPCGVGEEVLEAVQTMFLSLAI